MYALLAVLAVPITLASGGQDEPPSEEDLMRWLWVVAALCVAFALYLVADPVWKRGKKLRRVIWRRLKHRTSAFLRSTGGSKWSSDDKGGTAT